MNTDNDFDNNDPSDFRGQELEMPNQKIEISSSEQQKQAIGSSMNQEKNDIVDISNHISKNIRLGFIKKVYSLLLIQIAITIALINIGAYFVIKKGFVVNPKFSLSAKIIAGVGIIIITILVLCAPKIAKKVPINYVLLLLFTVFESILLFHFCTLFEYHNAILAFVLTVGLVLGINFYVWRTQKPISCLSILIFAIIGEIILGAIFIFFWLYFVKTAFQFFYVLICVLGTAIYAAYLAFDTQLMLGRFSNEFTVDDYVFAVLCLYIDIIRMFRYIFALIGSRR